MPKEDDKGAAAVRSIMAGATLNDVATILGVPSATLRKRLRTAFAAGFASAIRDSNRKKKAKNKKN